MNEYLGYALGAVPAFTKIGVMGPNSEAEIGVDRMRLPGAFASSVLLLVGVALAAFAVGLV